MTLISIDATSTRSRGCHTYTYSQSPRIIGCWTTLQLRYWTIANRKI